MPTGRPFEPGNKYGQGRPPGSRNKRSQVARELLEEYSEPLVRKAMVEALKGDGPLLRALLAFLLPRWSQAPVKTDPLPTRNAQDVRESMDRIFQKMSNGELSLREGHMLARMLGTRQSVLQQTEDEGRLDALEDALAEDLAKEEPNGPEKGAGPKKSD
jgi:hypothetical protein